MKLEHVAMFVNDLESARVFFVKYLGGRSNDGYYESCIVGIEGNQIEITIGDWLYFKLMFKNMGTLLKAAFGDRSGLDKLLDEMFYDYNDNH